MAGVAIVSAHPGHAAEPPLEEAQVELVWSVEGFDRETLDLEALRSYLTETAILLACRRHLADHGPHSLPGASYRQIAQPK